jgi:tRNA A-37 threonylcarbamoyl transferase component Bud32
MNMGRTESSANSTAPRIVLGSFRLLDVLGQGSFASAYLAEQVGTDRKAVVKIAHGHLLGGPQGAIVRQRFASEVRAATRVTHPNLVTIYTAGETDDGLPALAMEYLEGETLGARLRRGVPLAFDELFRGFAQLASALTLVHANRIIHRDISPDNVFLAETHDGLTIKLLDFGIARLQDLASGTSAMIGTPFYVAREQLRGMAETASDVYSVGSLLWWCLTGQEIYGHVTELNQLVYLLETQTEPPDPTSVCPTLPAAIAALVRSMLHPEPPERPTMASFLATWTELEPVLRAWWTPRSSRLVGIVMADETKATAVMRGLQREGHRVVRLPPRISAILGHQELDAIVIDAELTEPDPIAFVRHLSNVLPDVGLFAVSNRPFASAWLAERLGVCALVPEQLPELGAAIRRGETFEDGGVESERLSRIGSRPFRQRALGEIPELIATLDEAIREADAQTTMHQCELIERIAHLAELTEMGSLARTLRVLLEREAVDDPARFVHEMTRSFRESFPALLAAQEN